MHVSTTLQALTYTQNFNYRKTVYIITCTALFIRLVIVISDPFNNVNMFIKVLLLKLLFGVCSA
jgi:hypothetical protein